MTGNVEPGLPPFSLPNLTPTVGNHTYTLPEVVEELGVGIFIIPTVAVLANVAIAKAFSKFFISNISFLILFIIKSWRNSLKVLTELFSWNCILNIKSILTYFWIFGCFIFLLFDYNLLFNYFYLIKEC